MTINELAIALQTLFGLACIVGLLQLWRVYWLQWIRHRLLDLRDELFDQAAAGRIAFSDPAYYRLRRTYNTMIRLAHRLSPFSFVAAYLSRTKDDEALEPYRSWLEGVEQVPDSGMRQYLLNSYGTMVGVLAIYLFASAPIRTTILAFCVVLRKPNRNYRDTVTEKVAALEGQAEKIDCIQHPHPTAA